MELKPVANPPNPWRSTEVEYLEGEPPGARLEVYEDHSKSILATNDSPDLGRVTRGCLEVCAAYRNPVAIITKAPLVERDLDVLLRLRDEASVSVTISIPIMDREAAHALEPFVATPERRLRTIERLAAAGLDVGINVAPLKKLGMNAGCTAFDARPPTFRRPARPGSQLRLW